MIPGKSKYEKASNEILAKQNEIVSMMERYINCPEAVAAMRAVDAVTGESIDAMGVYRHDGFCWSTPPRISITSNATVSWTTGVSVRSPCSSIFLRLCPGASCIK